MRVWWLSLFAGVAGFLATVASRRIALRFGVTSQPNPSIDQHEQPIACLGGVGIWSGWLVVVVAAAVLGPGDELLQAHFPALAIAGTSFLVLGLLDDLRPFTPAAKLAAQVPCSVLSVGSGAYADVFSVGWLNFVFSALWLILVVNAVNVTDVCDGLAGGLAAIGLAAIGLAAIAAENSELELLAFPAAAATFGFLMLNWPPATIFLGDAGSHFLGALLGTLGLLNVRGDDLFESGASSVLMVGVFLFEVVVIIVARARAGRPVWRASPDHFAVRLQALGVSRAGTDVAAYLVAMLLSAVALALPSFAAPTQAALLGGCVLALAAAGVTLVKAV